MPTYEYKCDNCGHSFDVYQSMKDDKLKKCPNCGMDTLKRLIGTGGGLIFKGSGFYLTDYKNKPAEKSTSPASSGEKSGSKETSKKSGDTQSSNKPDSTKTEGNVKKASEKK